MQQDAGGRTFANFGADNTEPDPGAPDYGIWSGNRCERERIIDWFGPTDFRAARAFVQAHAHANAPSKTENTNADD